MKVIETVAELTALVQGERLAGRSIGLVPTMGALHAGHRSLVERAVADCDVVVVSVFVNPLQFGERGDLAAYPRTLPADVACATAAGAAVVFAPSVGEMYPTFPDSPTVTVAVSGIGDRLEGSPRPGHFAGVATVVTKLLAMTGPCRAYFGEKDWQQLAVVRHLVEDLSLPVEVVGCPTVREPDGLALSSRNVRLSSDERRAAASLYRALRAGEAAAKAGASVADVRRALAAVVEAEPLAALDYGEVVDPVTFCSPPVMAGELRLVIAASVGPVRLIDNLAVRLTASSGGSHEGSGSGPVGHAAAGDVPAFSGAPSARRSAGYDGRLPGASHAVAGPPPQSHERSTD